MRQIGDWLTKSGTDNAVLLAKQVERRLPVSDEAGGALPHKA
jgi:hypothetical protein